MQLKIAILWIFSLTVLLFVHQAQAQGDPQDRQLCQRLVARCAARDPQLPNSDVNSLNKQCRRERGSRWRNVTRCQIIRALCENTLVDCVKLNCEYISKVNGLT